MSYKVCIECDEKVDNDEKICPNCDGFFLKKKCPKCNEIMKDDIKKCWYCGWNFTDIKKKNISKKINFYESYINDIKNTTFKNKISSKYKKNYIKLTTEQIEIIKKARNSNLIINAFAGSGKTTTLLSIAYALRNKSFLFLAFNRSVKEEIEYKIKKSKLNNIKVLTTHGLAYKFAKNDLKFKKIGKELNTLEISKILDIDIFIADLVKIAFNDFCNGDYTSISDKTIEEILNSNQKLRFIKEQKEYLKTKLLNIWNLYIENKLPMTHNVYLKFFHLNIEKYRNYINFDYILLDEAQDTNEVVLDIFKKLKGKKIIVGDPHQQIYSFRGSINAMYKIRNEISAEISYLTESFRFPNYISNKANIILKDFKGEEKEIISFNQNSNNTISNMCFITRTNATLIKLIDTLKNFEIKLVRSPQEIFHLPLNIYYYIKYLNNGKYKDKIKERWILNFESLEELKNYAEDFEDYELVSAINIAEEYDEKLFSLLNMAKEKYKKNKGKIFLATAHSSKGLEWDKVVVCHDFQNLIDLLKKEKYKSIKNFQKSYLNHIHKIINGEKSVFKHQYIIDEINLFYVAITRTKKDLIIYSNSDIFNININEKLEE
ncbi:UvrD-helicase domain-containing protein [Marinitoga arctica]